MVKLRGLTSLFFGGFLPRNNIALQQTTHNGDWPSRLRGTRLVNGREHMSDLNQRIEAMYQADRRAAWLFVIALWVVILFVLFMSWPYIPDQGVRIVVVLAAAAVLIFNTASVAAMLRNYAEDKNFIYGLDIKHLDEMRKGH
jgi:hypothetical protein